MAVSSLPILITLTHFLFFSSPVSSLVWPQPRHLSWPHHQAAFLSPTFTIITAPTTHRYLPAAMKHHLSAAVKRYRRLIFTEHHHPLVPPSVALNGLLTSLTVTVRDPAARLQNGVDESYNLAIPAAGFTANLSAATVWGAMRGLETFSQLVWGDPLRVPIGLSVWDAPMFEHRGVMLDTARNFYRVKDILRTIRAMSANKLNVFHWHITDSQSFPLLLPSEPDLAVKGSYGKGMMYTPADVRRVVDFGLDHGVRVLPEIDSPGHSGSWAKAYPEIVTCANMFWWPAGSKWEDRLASEPGTGQLNPLKPKTYRILRNVFRDMIKLFPEQFFHAGADEVIPGCWKTDPTIQSFLSKNRTLSQLLEKFVNSTLPYLVSHNLTVVYWEDVLLDDNVKVHASFLPPEHTILQTWHMDPNNTKRIVSSGYRAIVSSADFYYLDCGHGDFVGNDTQYDRLSGGDSGNGGSWCGPFKTWQTIYNHDITRGLSEKEAKLVLGGEVALWSEQADSTVLDARLWPRASAMAESLWSGNRDKRGEKRFAEATDRLNEWRHRMVGRDIGAEPIQPLWCARNPGMCNTVNY